MRKSDIEQVSRLEAVTNMTEKVIMADDASLQIEHLRAVGQTMCSEMLDKLRQALCMDMAAVCIVGAKEVEVMASSGQGAPAVASRTPCRHDMCGFTILPTTPEPFIVGDAKEDPRFYQHPWVAGYARRGTAANAEGGSDGTFVPAGCFAGVAIRDPAGQAVGVLCVMARSRTDPFGRVIPGFDPDTFDEVGIAHLALQATLLEVEIQNWSQTSELGQARLKRMLHPHHTMVEALQECERIRLEVLCHLSDDYLTPIWHLFGTYVTPV